MVCKIKINWHPICATTYSNKFTIRVVYYQGTYMFYLLISVIMKLTAVVKTGT